MILDKFLIGKIIKFATVQGYLPANQMQEQFSEDEFSAEEWKRQKMWRPDIQNESFPNPGQPVAGVAPYTPKPIYKPFNPGQQQQTTAPRSTPSDSIQVKRGFIKEMMKK